MREKPLRKISVRDGVSAIATTPAHTLSEKEFTHQVIQVAELYGWLVYFIPDSRLASCRGYPDLTLLYPGNLPRLLVRELKVGKGRVRPEQHTWLNGLRACGFDAGMWRESDWQEIEQTLSRT